MLVGRGLERLDRSRSHHILSQEEVIVIFCANNINLGEVVPAQYNFPQILELTHTRRKVGQFVVAQVEELQ